jgi:cytochrome c
LINPEQFKDVPLMVKTAAVIFICLFIRSAFTSAGLSYPLNKIEQENHAPVVKIITPENNNSFASGSRVQFSIAVEDKEDGSSRYDEINPKEVLLSVKYVSNTEALKKALKNPVQLDAPGLAAMRISNCFNCHNFDNKLNGPSFREISMKYQPIVASLEMLIKSIRDGSSGVWGKVPMPSHPELNHQEIQDIAKWITQLASHDDIDYYIGTEGFFHLPFTPAGRKSLYLLTASYVDHGTSNAGRLRGQSEIVISSR